MAGPAGSSRRGSHQFTHLSHPLTLDQPLPSATQKSTKCSAKTSVRVLGCVRRFKKGAGRGCKAIEKDDGNWGSGNGLQPARNATQLTSLPARAVASAANVTYLARPHAPTPALIPLFRLYTYAALDRKVLLVCVMGEVVDIVCFGSVVLVLVCCKHVFLSAF